MITDEELITERNMQIIASALLDVMKLFLKIGGCENKYIRDLGDDLVNKYGEQLKDITNNVNDV